MAYARAGLHERVPQADGVLGGDPQLVAQVAGVAGPADVDRDAADRRRRAAGSSAGPRTTRRSRPRGPARDSGPWRASAAVALGGLLDRHVEPGRVLAQPAQLRVGGGPAEPLVVQAVDRAVVDDLAVLVAPRRVEDLADGQLRRVAGDDPVDEAERRRAPSTSYL